MEIRRLSVPIAAQMASTQSTNFISLINIYGMMIVKRIDQAIVHLQKIKHYRGMAIAYRIEADLKSKLSKLTFD